jgi:hypothetical protein
MNIFAADDTETSAKDSFSIVTCRHTHKEFYNYKHNSNYPQLVHAAPLSAHCLTIIISSIIMVFLYRTICYKILCSSDANISKYPS